MKSLKIYFESEDDKTRFPSVARGSYFGVKLIGIHRLDKKKS